MGIRDIFRPRVIIQEVRVHDSDYHHGSTSYGGKTKYGNIKYQSAGYTDYAQQRENARGVYNDSLIARGITRRLVDLVINTGLTRECTPLWDEIPEWKKKSDEEKYAWTEHVEHLWTLYSKSKEADARGRQTLNQLQRLLYLLRVKEGETFSVCRYLNAAGRTSPLTLQTLNNDQIQQPYDAVTTEAIKARGYTCKEGVEYDATGKMAAIYVKEDLEKWDQPLTRIPVEGPKSKRRFVIHDANFESADSFRGFPELSAFVYELDRLTEYDINELEAVVANSIWAAAIETEKGAKAGGGIKPAAGATKDMEVNEVEGGIYEVNIKNRALILQNLKPGQKMKPFETNRPNQNYQNFIEHHINIICDSLGLSRSAFLLKFEGSYSSARAEILFLWLNIIVRRDDFSSGFLDPFFEAWFTEHVRSGEIIAPGFLTRPVSRQAWLYGTWDGVARPIVDPVKEVNAIKLRLDLGHTTNEREAKIYNGSDFRENIRRLEKENTLRRDANLPVNPDLAPDPDYDPNGKEKETPDD